jgi:hypothetical protein
MRLETQMSGSNELRTNRDLYLFVAEICRANAQSDRTLEDYLKALWRLGSVERERGALPLARFAALLEEALRSEAPQFDPIWSRNYLRDMNGFSGYVHWEQTILRQIVDLHEMEEAGTLGNDLRYFGVDAPRGLRWFNFDPLTFLECAAAGTFDGWRSGDPAGRDYVPGPVAVLDEAGRISSADPRDLGEPTVDLGPISWDTFAEFLGAGQWYE